ncbi:unnamed protein product [Sphagnum jensenii]|uniref:Uncharacterized protein n=1 Tax=Sphagnum jensenii TaxID=128206 RepID=A0ABP1BQ79_9BRYO
MPIFIAPHYFGLAMVDGSTQTSSLLGNGPYMAHIFARFHSVPMNPNAEEFYPWYMQEQSQSTLTFSPIPAYSPIPEIVPDADEIISQQQHANAAAADTADTTGAIRLGTQAANNSETKELGVIQKWKALKKH